MILSEASSVNHLWVGPMAALATPKPGRSWLFFVVLRTAGEILFRAGSMDAESVSKLTLYSALSVFLALYFIFMCY
jgi:hypothetical protein